MVEGYVIVTVVICVTELSCELLSWCGLSGEHETADQLLNQFKWGHAFLSLNR
jgi:ribosome biogenesis protein Tsr3